MPRTGRPARRVADVRALPGRGAAADPCPAGAGLARVPSVHGLGHAVSGAVSAVVVLAAFVGLLGLADRVLGRSRSPYPRLRVPGYRRTSVLGWLARAAWWLVRLAGRFAAGAPLGQRRTDATFLTAGTKVIGGVPGWLSTGQPSRSAFWPGWKRAAVRWGVVAAAAGLAARPLTTGVMLGVLAVAGSCAGWPRFQRWQYERRVTRPVYLQLCQYLDTDQGDRPGRWLDIPAGFTTDQDAQVTLAYPAAWNPDAARQKHIDEVIRRHLGGDLACSFGPYQAVWTHPPAPPELARFDGYDLPAHKIHLATLPGGHKWIADLQDEEPHLFIAAGTGGGKTATASIPAAHVRANGWLVDIIDPKRRSYISRKTGHDVLTNVPGIRVHTDIESMMWALEEFYLSMLGVNIAVGAHTAWPGLFPQRMLVIDEFGTFASMAARMHQRSHGQGQPPALDQRRQIEWQGRQAGHRLVVAVHQPNLRWFGDTDSRGQYGYRLITGAYTASLWRMTFGYTAPIQWDTRIKGRGVVGIGEAEELIHHAQIAWMPAEERRRYALTGPPPPDWFTDMQPAPWITGHVISEGRKLAGASLVRLASDDDVPADVPPGPDGYVPAQRHPDVPADVPPPDNPTRPLAIPARRAGRHRATAARDGQPVTSTRAGGRHRAADPGRTAIPSADDGLIIGLADAASYLGYDKPDSFRRARTRNPVPGEGKMPDGRPCWTPAALRSWQSKRKIAGNRAPAGEPD
jgi:hypothetical protein